MSTRKTHELKTDPEVFDAVARGDKTFEIRCNDRGFNVGDTLWLRETRATGAQMRAGLAPLIYTGREEFRHVSHVLIGYGLTDGWCCLSFASVVAASPSDTSQGVSEAKDAARYRFWRKFYRSAFAVSGVYRLKFKPSRPAVEIAGPDYEQVVDAALDEAMARAALRSEPGEKS